MLCRHGHLPQDDDECPDCIDEALGHDDLVVLPCTCCGVNQVVASQGYDTCDECLRNA